MPTLREHTREALSSTMPDEREAREHLERIRRRARGRRASRAWLLAPSFAAVAVVLYLVAIHRRSPTVSQRAEPMTRGVHLYLRASYETEEHAIFLDLETQGEH